MDATFNSSRFFRCLWREIMLGIRPTVAKTASLALAFTSIAITYMSKEGITFDEFSQNYYAAVMFCSAAFVCFGGGLAFGQLGNKGSRLSELMLPASVSEKYLSSLLLSVAGCGVMISVAYLLAEAIRFAILPLFGLGEGFHRSTLFFVKSLVVPTVGYADSHMLSLNITFPLLLWLYSFYIIGCQIWQKLPALKTTGAIAVVLAAVSMAAFMVNDAVSADAELGRMLGSVGWSVVDAVLILLSVGNLWIAYRMYSRMQIVKIKRNSL